jgi:hypothetical protein
MNLDIELRYYYIVFRHFVYCYILMFIIVIMMLCYVVVYGHCFGYDLVLTSI